MKHVRAILRITAFFASSFILYGLWFVGHFVIPNKQYWRQVIFSLWSRFFVRISALKVDVIGDVPKPPFFMVSNHLSYADIPVLRSIVDSVFVAKGEIKAWPLAGRMVGDMENIFIDRNNRRDIPRAGDEILRKLEGGEGVIVFPEGTSSKGEEILKFNSSFFEFAARTDLPIHYAAITYRVEDPSTSASESVCWWDDTGLLAHMYRFFGVKDATAIVTFGAEPVASPDRKELAERLWAKVKDRFVPVI
jgi:1-acyl-sn-glycerol-3-phosphate acyltransferase